MGVHCTAVILAFMMGREEEDPWLHVEMEASLRYTRLHLKKKMESEVIR